MGMLECDQILLCRNELKCLNRFGFKFQLDIVLDLNLCSSKVWLPPKISRCNHPCGKLKDVLLTKDMVLVMVDFVA